MHTVSLHHCSSRRQYHIKENVDGAYFEGCLGFLCQHSELKELESLFSSYHRSALNLEGFSIPASQLTDAVCCSKTPQSHKEKGILTNETISYN